MWLPALRRKRHINAECGSRSVSGAETKDVPIDCSVHEASMKSCLAPEIRFVVSYTTACFNPESNRKSRLRDLAQAKLEDAQRRCADTERQRDEAAAALAAEQSELQDKLEAAGAEAAQLREQLAQSAGELEVNLGRMVL